MRSLCGVGSVLVVLLLASCAPGRGVGGEVSPPVPVSDELTTRFVLQVVEALRESFVARDPEGFMKHVSEGFYRGSARLRDRLEVAFALPGALSLDVEILGVEEQDQRIDAVVSWRFARKDAAGGMPDEKTGETTLIFRSAGTISLVDFRGAPLFGVEGL